METGDRNANELIQNLTIGGLKSRPIYGHVFQLINKYPLCLKYTLVLSIASGALNKDL